MNDDAPRDSDAPTAPGCLTAPFGCLFEELFELLVICPIAAGITYVVMTRVVRQPLDSPLAWAVFLVVFAAVGVSIAALAARGLKRDAENDEG